MEIPKQYNPKGVEDKWYQEWMENDLFASRPDERQPYTIVMPPPNVTGVLHMGHMLNNTIQDILIRRARMIGKNACWVPGTDHASIATEAKVVAMLKQKGIKKSDLTREEFLKYAWEWKEKHGGIILEQLKKLGASCDWHRTKFTMDPDLSEAVIDCFIDLYNRGYIYRGKRMIHWDCEAKTALSDEEVIYKEHHGWLYYVKYLSVDNPGQWLTVATTRPETILADVAVCVNPKDERYRDWIGRKVLVPLVNREVPVIADSYVDMEFGTGCLKITPAHDPNDYEIGQKYNLPIIDILTDDGKLNENAGWFVGEDRFAARKLMVDKLRELGLIEKEEEINNTVGYSERTNVVVEPRLSLQWFVDMKKFMKDYPQVLTAVLNDEIAFHPPKFKNLYRHWIENIKDWCISRQLWWGHRIPAWYCDNRGCEEVVMISKTKPQACDKCGQSDTLYQDEDVLDTWFSSWLWPISVFDGFKDPGNPDISYYYPTDDLVTAPEIMFFWVAKMIMAGYAFRGEKPFKNVYYTGIVRDKLGRKMSKSLGNSPDPILLMDQYSADGVRVGMLFSSPAGNDLLFDESLCEQGRNYANKIWNAFRLINSWQFDDSMVTPEVNKLSVLWFENFLNQKINELEDHFQKFRISDALITLYKLTWDDFCSWYLELIKPKEKIDKLTYDKTLEFFSILLKLNHPFMPFITEEIWHYLPDRESTYIMTAKWPKAAKVNQDIIEYFENIRKIIIGVRQVRSQYNIALKETLELIPKNKQLPYFQWLHLVEKLANVEVKPDRDVKRFATILAGNDSFMVSIENFINEDAEKEKILKEINYWQGFLTSVEKKLSNQKFVQNAPVEIVEKEKKKKQDAEAKLQQLHDALEKLKN